MPNSSNVKETIDSRILRLLGLEDVFDLDYDTYLILLKEAIVKNSFGKNKLPDEELALLANERKRIRGKSGRFKVKNKKINTQSFGIGKVKIVPKKIKSEKLLPGTQTQSYLPGGELSPIAAGSTSYLKSISESLGNIIKILNSSIQLEKKSSEKKRLERERAKREGEESKLEKGFSLVKKAVFKVIAPVKTILSSIIDFFMKMFLGRVVYKLLEWLADPKNQDKLKSVFRFLGDNWAKLLSLYIMFGTSFGKFARGLISIVIKGGAALARATAILLAKAGVGKAGKVAGFLGGKYGKLAVAGLEAATTVGATMALSGGLESFGGIGNDSKEKPTTPKFAGGGLADLGSLFKMGSNNMIGSLSEMLGFERFREQTAGLINGQKGVDKIPAMLSDGEFVMSRGAVQKYGVDVLEAMNAAGGGTNKPKIVKGTTFAKGGGQIGNSPDLKEKPPEKGLRPSVEDIISTSHRAQERNYYKNRGVGGMGAGYRGQELQLSSKANASQVRNRLKGTFAGMVDVTRSGKGNTWKEKRYRSSSDNKFYANYNDALAAHQSRLMSTQGINLSGDISNRSKYQGSGGELMGAGTIDRRSLPKTQIMTGPDGRAFVGHLSFKGGKPVYQRPGARQKGFLENISDFFNPGGSKAREDNLRKKGMRMSAIDSLSYYKKIGMTDANIDKQLKKLGVDPKQARNDLAAKEKRVKRDNQIRQQAGMAQYSTSNIMRAQNARGVSNLGKDYRGQELQLAAKANAAQIKAKPLSKGVQPLPKKPVKVTKRSKADLMGSGINQSTRSTSPKISASHPAGTRNKEATLGLRR
jgi:hypothetical protein